MNLVLQFRQVSYNAMWRSPDHQKFNSCPLQILQHLLKSSYKDILMWNLTWRHLQWLRSPLHCPWRWRWSPRWQALQVQESLQSQPHPHPGHLIDYMEIKLINANIQPTMHWNLLVYSKYSCFRSQLWIPIHEDEEMQLSQQELILLLWYISTIHLKCVCKYNLNESMISGSLLFTWY